MRRVFLIVAAALTSVGCATALRLAPVTPGSAADPNAPEPPRGMMSETLRPEAPPNESPVVPAMNESGQDHSAHTGHTEDSSMPSATIYTCPMHPEVRSEVPGTCPKCGMKLVPAKPPDPGAPK